MLKFGMEVKSVFVQVCIYVHVIWLKGGLAMGVASCKMAHNFQMNSQISTRFNGKVGYEPKDS